MSTKKQDPHHSKNSKTLTAIGLGNTLEWYDWQIFGLLAAFIGPNFFPNADPVSSTLSALSVFAVGFAFRPLGGVLLGRLADRIGRRKVLLLSITMMAVSTLVIAISPTYQDIGVFAGLLLFVCRVFQGISAGIEAPLSTAYAVELSPAGREGRAAGVLSMFVNLGILGASLVSFATSALIDDAAMADGGWRVPMFVGAALGVVVIYLRRNLPESLPAATGTGPQAPPPVWRQVGRHWLALLAIIFVVGAAQAYNYAWNVGLPNLANGFGEDSTSVFALTTLLGLILLVGSPLVGMLADRRKLSRTFVATRLLVVPAAFLMLAYAGPGIGGFSIVLLVGGLVLVTNMTLYNVISTSLMPQTCRATGVGLGYGIAVALFGGTASYLLIWLQQQGIDWLFPVYLAALSLISVVLYLLAKRTTGLYAGE
nr:MFS transporter [Tamaricihabitans halophyticus]